MSTYVARQPIFDSDVQTHGYELVYPDQRPIDDDELLLAGRTRFLSIDWDAVLHGTTRHLNPTNTVLQLYPRGEDQSQFRNAIYDLKSLGFHVALNLDLPDRIDHDLSSQVDYISVNAAESDQVIIEEIARRFGGGATALLAYHVDLRESVEMLKAIGYEYFHGAFYAHPVSTGREDIPASATARLMLLREINQVELDIDRVAKAISADVGLTFKLLTLVNSAAMGLRREVTSVKQAALMLGEIAIRKWATVLIVRDFGSQQPSELLVHSLIRANFCELFAQRGPFYDRASEMYLMGLFSMIDAVLDRPMSVILKELPLALDIKEALQGEQNQVAQVLDMVTSYECGNWRAVERIAAVFAQQEERVSIAYRQAITDATAVPA